MPIERLGVLQSEGQRVKGCQGTQAAGIRIGFADCAIAAIAMARGFMLATRNTKNFKGAGVELLNPWASRHERII
jgi:predicted nucleic acid-binding protein